MKNVRPDIHFPSMPRVSIPDRTFAWQNHKPIQISKEAIDMATLEGAAKGIVAFAKKANKYIRDALGITEPEPPIIADHPPIHMVDGVPQLGDNNDAIQ
jgi:hypothetical protein